MPGPILPAPAVPPTLLPARSGPTCHGPGQSGRALGTWERRGAHGCGTGPVPLTAWPEEQEQGEPQQEGCPGTAPGHGLLRGFGITWNGESGLSWRVGKGLGTKRAGGAMAASVTDASWSKMSFCRQTQPLPRSLSAALTPPPPCLAAHAAAGAGVEKRTGEVIWRGPLRHSLPPALGPAHPDPGVQRPMPGRRHRLILSQVSSASGGQRFAVSGRVSAGAWGGRADKLKEGNE